MANLAKYVVQLEAETAKYKRELDQANNKLSKFHRDQRKALDGIRRGFQRLAGAIGAVAFANYIKQSIDAADSANKLSQQIGLATETITGLGLGIKLSGGSVQDFEKGMIRLARSASDANSGLATQKRAFDELGVSVSDSQGRLRPLDGLLRDLADSFANMDDGAQKAARAQEIFGRSGTKLIPFLNQGSAGLDEIIKRSEKLGLVWSKESAAAAEQFNDNLTLLSAVSRGFANQLAQEMLPELNNLTAAMIVFSEESEAAVKVANLLAFVFKSLATGVIVIVDGVETLAKRVLALKDVLAKAAVLDFAGAKEVIDQFNDDVETRFNAVTNTINTMWGNTAESAKKSLEDQRASMLAMLQANQESARADGASRSQEEAARRQVEALKLQADTLGMTSAQVRLFTLASLGATDAQLQSARASLEAVAAYEESIDRQKQARQDFEDSLARFDAGQEQLQSVKEGLRTEEEAIRESYERRLQIIRDNTTAGTEEQEKLVRRLVEQTETQLEALKESSHEMSEFSRRAAQNMQDAFANFLFDPFDKGVKGMLKEFTRVLARMAAEAAAAKIFESFSGGGFFGAIGGLFGGARAKGGPVDSGRAYLVGEQGPELFVPGATGNIIPNGGGGAVVNQTINIPLTFPPQLEAYVRNVAGPAGRDAAMGVLNAQRGRI